MNHVDTTQTEPLWLQVEGMSCGSCAANVERALCAVPGAERVSVDLAGGRARIEGAPDPQQLVTAIQRAGFGAQLIADPAAQEVGHVRRGCC